MNKFPLVSMVKINRARDHFFSQGKVPSGLISEAIVRSWERSSSNDLSTDKASRYTGEQLKDRLEQSKDLLRHSLPVMENLYEQIIRTSSMVLLTDAAGVVLHSIGDNSFVNRASKVSLKPGGIWDEEVRGTNAIGTALMERAPMVVHSAEHFVTAHHFLTCSASPIFDPHGQVLGVLDVSTDCRAQQQHTMALVRISAQQIENQLFSSDFGDQLQLHFHTRPEFVGTLYEAIAVFSPEGLMQAANRSALLHLGIDRYETEKQNISDLFETSLENLLRYTGSSIQPVRKLRTSNGMEVYCRVKYDQSRVTRSLILPPSHPSLDKPAVRKWALDDLEAGDPTMQKIIAKVRKVQGHDIPVLLQGNSGTGKELFAQGMHNSGLRSNRSFVALNCAALPEGLIEAELFGYEEGAFTGAKRKGSIGKIRQADGGTLFLDEIGDMPLSLQGRLLRILQERTVLPLGGSETHDVNFALICATNRNIREEISAGRFREDLYYRLNGLTLNLPPLCQRADRLPLAGQIIKDLVGGRQGVQLSQEVTAIFLEHPWPGNIRQMHNVLRTAIALLGDDAEITCEHLSDDFLEQYHSVRLAPEKEATSAAALPPNNLGHLEITAIQQEMANCSGNISAAARRLGISRNTLYRKLKQLRATAENCQ